MPRLAIYLPKAPDPENYETWDEIHYGCTTNLIALGGGATEIEANGYWKGSHGLVSEPVVVLYTLVPRITRKIHKAMLNMGSVVKSQLHQESVLIELGSKHKFI